MALHFRPTTTLTLTLPPADDWIRGELRLRVVAIERLSPPCPLRVSFITPNRGELWFCIHRHRGPSGNEYLFIYEEAPPPSYPSGYTLFAHPGGYISVPEALTAEDCAWILEEEGWDE